MRLVEKNDKRIVFEIDLEKKLGCTGSIAFIKPSKGGVDILYDGANPWLPDTGIWKPWRKIRIIIEGEI